MPSIRPLAAALALWSGLACADALLAPTSDTLAGRWSTAPEQLSPSGQFVRTLEFSADGRFVWAFSARGVYPQLPADSVGSFTREYGTYRLASDTLFLAQDSVRTWNWLGGGSFHVGPAGIAIEGPPTPPIVALTRTRLTLRFMVNPGDRYRPVVQEYHRDR